MFENSPLVRVENPLIAQFYFFWFSTIAFTLHVEGEKESNSKTWTDVFQRNIIEGIEMMSISFPGKIQIKMDPDANFLSPVTIFFYFLWIVGCGRLKLDDLWSFVDFWISQGSSQSDRAFTVETKYLWKQFEFGKYCYVYIWDNFTHFRLKKCTKSTIRAVSCGSTSVNRSRGLGFDSCWELGFFSLLFYILSEVCS